MASATILLLRDGVEGLEVLMQQRHQEVGDFAGALTFPGGKVVPADSSAAVRARADGVEARRDDELAFAASAVRETFEECGVLLAAANRRWSPGRQGPSGQRPSPTARRWIAAPSS